MTHALLHNHDTGPSAELECHPGDAALDTDEVQEGAGNRILVRVTSVRKRLLDEDNLCEKYHIDLCRYAGILPSDAAGETKIETTQRKTGKGEEEHTVIEIWKSVA